MKRLLAVLMMFLLTGVSKADVFNMGDGLTSLEFVTVGNPGNAADSTGYGAVDHVYQIGKFEVTAGQYTEFLNAVAATDTYGLYSTLMWSRPDYGCRIERHGSSGSYTYTVAADWANRPVGDVSFWDAARFVNWLHNGQGSGDTESGAYINIGNTSTFARQPGAQYWIPSEDEWYKAAYHKNDGVTGNYFAYPTCSDSEPSNLLMGPDPGNNANFTIGNEGYTIGSPYYTTEVGEFENSASPYGTFDQGGNLHEWNETERTEFPGIRGGWWGHRSNDLLASTRYLDPPDRQHFAISFRVASVPEPASFALFLCSALTGLLCWWRKRKLSG